MFGTPSKIRSLSLHSAHPEGQTKDGRTQAGKAQQQKGDLNAGIPQEDSASVMKMIMLATVVMTVVLDCDHDANREGRDVPAW